MTLENMDRDINALIAKLHADERIHKSSHFSSTRYNDEPIIFTGRQMSSYMPDRYREMRAISRWQEGANGGRGRWLSEDEFFYLQATLMADFEDDCPYQGTFKAYSPTYNAMSDRQLRGYFTWRTQVRAGNVEETSLSFAFVYLYELLCGIGCADAQDGFRAIKSFWETYRTFAPELDRYVRVWLADYVVYHNLPASLLEDSRTLEFDRALIALKHAQAIAEQQAPQQNTPSRGGAPIRLEIRQGPLRRPSPRGVRRLPAPGRTLRQASQASPYRKSVWREHLAPLHDVCLGGFLRPPKAPRLRL